MLKLVFTIQWGSKYSGDLKSKHLNNELSLVRYSDAW